ncbi:MAG: type II toxin-antitoxin system RelE/ParE family toxin [Gammaproteobacteria bacterium]|nr:type II toxin-antitoxin system RelE/ParE family toxin [Gammaproteobacteria bacterium]
MYTIVFAEGVADTLKAIRAYDLRRLLATMDRQLQREPARQTRNRKVILGLKVPWTHEEPIWELRVGEYRVFYDVDEPRKRVIVRAVRRKAPHQTSEEML